MTADEPVEGPKKRRSQLSPPDFQHLNWACIPLVEAYGPSLYLVGSVEEHADFRDIDLRLILSDAKFKRLFGGRKGPERLRLLNVAVSDFISRNAGTLPKPVDFQFQSQTEANRWKGSRNPMGIPRAVVLDELQKATP